LSIIVRFNLVVRAKNHLFIMLPVEHTSQISQCLLKTIAHVQFPGIHTSHAQNKPCEPSSRTMLVVCLYWCFLNVVWEKMETYKTSLCTSWCCLLFQYKHFSQIKCNTIVIFS